MFFKVQPGVFQRMKDSWNTGVSINTVCTTSERKVPKGIISEFFLPDTSETASEYSYGIFLTKSGQFF